MPIGVQIVGRVFDEATLIRLAAEIEQVSPWADRTPMMEG
jgi:Asp-tRNA(Asn)/Glu-tRNA(Gln) amidotransferase A subunit family amidase